MNYNLNLNILVGNEDRVKTVLENLKKNGEKIGLKLDYNFNLKNIQEDSNGKQRIPLRVLYTLPKMGEYRLIATLEIHEGKNLIKYVDNKYEEYIDRNIRNVTPYCHHCQQNRKRRYLYLIWDSKNKRVLQLGKSCSKTYVGMRNVDRLYKYVTDLGGLEKRIKEEERRIVGQYSYINVDLFSRVVFSELVDNYKEGKYVTGEFELQRNVFKKYEEYKKNKLSQSEVSKIDGEEVEQLVKECEEYIRTNNKVGRTEYNINTLYGEENIRSTYAIRLFDYYVKYINSIAKGYNSEDRFNVVDVINVAFNLLTTEGVEFKYEGEESSFKEVIKTVKESREGVGVRSDLESLRNDWLENIYKNEHKNFESLISDMLNNNEGGNIKPTEVKIVTNNIGFYIDNNYNSEGSFIGEVGSRINQDVKIKSVETRIREAYTGGDEEVHIYNLIGEGEESLMWVSTKPLEEIESITGKTKDDLKTQTFRISARVKGHKVFRKRKFTIINYVKVIG